MIGADSLFTVIVTMLTAFLGLLISEIHKLRGSFDKFREDVGDALIELAVLKAKNEDHEERISSLECD